jgi:putative endonuclease
VARTASAPAPSACDGPTARGRRAESLAATWLAARGFLITARNVRVDRDELDLIAWDGATLVIVEVRSARPGAMVDPRETLRGGKRQRLHDATLRYAQHIGARDVRVDFVAVRGDEVEHFENALELSVF